MLDFGTVEGHSGYGQATSRLQLSDALATAELRRDEAKMTYTDQCTLGAVRARRADLGPAASRRRLRPGPPRQEGPELLETAPGGPGTAAGGASRPRPLARTAACGAPGGRQASKGGLGLQQKGRPARIPPPEPWDPTAGRRRLPVRA